VTRITLQRRPNQGKSIHEPWVTQKYGAEAVAGARISSPTSGMTARATDGQAYATACCIGVNDCRMAAGS
jgi:hypothetical protein